MPVAKPTSSVTTFIRAPKAASPAHTAKASAAQNNAMPSIAHPTADGRTARG